MLKNPGEMAKAEGDQLNIDLPFLIKDTEARSVAGFLYDLLDTHQGISHGIFSVGSLHAEPGSNKAPGDSCEFQIGFTAWLAPFDLGVMQHVAFTIKPSDTFDRYLDIKMTIHRRAGEQNTWWRVNKRFVNLIRKQLLIWRSLEDAQKNQSAQFMASVLDAPVLNP
jgi:hypothetical protein